MPPSRRKISTSSKAAPPPADAVSLANAYARDVVAGSIPACKWVRLACQRHLDDVERTSSGGWRYVFYAAKALRAVRFIEALPHVKGKWATSGERIKLPPWQAFIICSLFGWVDKSTGFYRFRRAYVCIPRKNGKSTLAAAIGLYKLAADGETGAEVYSGATTEKQAWEVFRPARQMAERTPAMRSAFGLSVHAKSLSVFRDGGRFEPVIGNPGDGASPSCAIVDEYHEHLSDSLHDTMLSGMGARDNPLLLVITTAGSDRSGPCYALQGDVQKVLDGRIQDDQQFGIIYTIDDEDDWKAEESLGKANPNFGISVSGEFLLEQQRGAVASARKQNTFRTKHLNCWVNADVAWMNMTAWDRCADTNLRIEDFHREYCFIGIDLASRVDIAASVRLFRRHIGGKAHYYLFGRYYLNEAKVEESANQHYAGWANEQLLTVTPGNITDYGWIADDLLSDSEQFRILEIPHDPWHAAALVQFVQAKEDWDQSVQFVEMRPTVQNFSPAMKELEAIVLDGRLHHDGDPIMSWMISNVVCHRDAKENIYPRKEREENKIDGPVALIMALGRAMLHEGGSVYDTRGIITV